MNSSPFNILRLPCIPLSQRRVSLFIQVHQNAGIALSNGSLAVSQANQSDLVVLQNVSITLSVSPPNITYGNNPIPLTFHIPNASARICMPT